MKLCVETVGLPATATRPKAEAGSMTHQLPLRTMHYGKNVGMLCDLQVFLCRQAPP